MRLVILGMALGLPASALACPPRTATASTPTPANVEDVAHADASSCARKAELVGSACSYTTGMMAQRVISEGAEFAFTGTLTPSDNALDSRVAAPYTLAQGALHVVANQVIENMPSNERVNLIGRRMNVNGTDYFVVESFSVASST